MMCFSLRTVARTGLAIAILLANTAVSQAQPFLKAGPDGSLGFSNGDGTFTFIHPSRLTGGGPVVGGPTMTLPNGSVLWLNNNGSIGGNIIDPSTGDVHLRYAAKKHSASVKSHVVRPSTGYSSSIRPKVTSTRPRTRP